MSNTLLQMLKPDVRDALRDILFDGQPWESAWVDYDKPNVERVWRQWGINRMCLHRIHPCNPGESFYHPHPWPSEMWILDGQYEHGIGYGAGIEPPPIAAKIMMVPGSSYEMTDPDAWHYVRPIGKPAITLMVSGRPFDPPRLMPKMPSGKCDPLAHDKKEELLHFFRALYL